MSGSRNLMIIYTATANKSLSSTDGTLADNTGYKTSDYIKVEPSTEYAISYYGSVMGTYTVTYYTETKTFISAQIFTDEDVLAFKDINPAAPIHVLVIPKKHITSLATMEDGDEKIISKIKFHKLIKFSKFN